MMIKKVNDITKKESDFKYKVIPHKNGLDCLHCDFEEREKSLKDMIEKGSDNETIPKDGGGKLYLKKVIVVRGKYDDVIGWSKFWQ